MGHHDALFKRVFSAPEHAAGELRSVLPARTLEEIDLDQLRHVAGSFIDAELFDRHADLLFRAPLHRGGSVFVYVLFEHQSEPDSLMPLRLLAYMVRIWEQHSRTHRSTSSLPPIVALVVHNGASGWRCARALRDVVGNPSDVPELTRYVPDFEVIVDDLVTQSDAELKARPVAAVARLALWLLRDARRGSAFAEALAAWVELLETVAQEPTRRADVQALLRYAYEVAATEHFEDVRTAILGKAPHVEDAMQTMYEFLVEKGRAEGKAEGKRQLLERLVETRLGALPDDVRARLARSSEAELERVSDRVFEARSFADLFA